jgi:hypothetical protein
MEIVIMSFNFCGTNVFKTAAVLSAIGYGWFTLISPEAVGADGKADFFLVAFFAALAAYFYTDREKVNESNEREAVYRYIDDLNRSNERNIDNLTEQVHSLQDKCCDRKSR